MVLKELTTTSSHSSHHPFTVVRLHGLVHTDDRLVMKEIMKSLPQIGVLPDDLVGEDLRSTSTFRVLRSPTPSSNCFSNSVLARSPRRSFLFLKNLIYSPHTINSRSSTTCLISFNPVAIQLPWSASPVVR